MSQFNLSSLGLSEGKRSISFYALRVQQPIGDFFSAVIPANKLVDICFFDIRGLTQRENFANFMGIQRQLDISRVAEIKRYVNSFDPSFPTAIVLAVDERCAAFTDINIDESEAGSANLVKMTLTNYPEPDEGFDPILYKDIARIIDGQHRIAGLIDYQGPAFDLNVSIFVGADIATQASIFSTVNLAQTKVNKSLVYDLFEYERTRSPEKTCHEIAVILDREPDSPFYHRIKRLGVATSGKFGETLAQATFVKGLLQYVSRDVLGDRDAAKRGRLFPEPVASYRDKLIFREFFVNSHDEVIADILWDYFDAVKERWPLAWSKTGPGWVLNKTAGYSALMRFLLPCYKKLSYKENIPTKNDFAKVFRNSSLPEESFMSQNVRPGTSGERYVFDLLMESSGMRDLT